MRQVDAEITVSIGGRDSISADSVIVADSSSVPGSDRVLNNTIYTGVSVHGHHVFKDGRADWRQLKNQIREKLYFSFLRDWSIHSTRSRRRTVLVSRWFDWNKECTVRKNIFNKGNRNKFYYADASVEQSSLVSYGEKGENGVQFTRKYTKYESHFYNVCTYITRLLRSNSYNQQTISGRNSCTCTLFVKKYSNLLLLCLILKQLYQYVSAVPKKNYKACVLTKLYHGDFHFGSNCGFPNKSRDKSAPKNTFSWRLVLVENCTVHWWKEVWRDGAGIAYPHFRRFVNNGNRPHAT